MSTIYYNLKRHHLSARQDRRLDKVATLGPVIGDIERIAKDEMRDITNEDSIAVIRKHLKGINELLSLAENSPTSEIAQRKAIFLEEKGLLEYFLPQQLTSDEVRRIVNQNQLTSMKDAMPYFKHHYAGRFDGNLISKAFR